MPAVTRITKEPSWSVITPVVVPGTITEAPMTGSPFTSATVPRMVDWAWADSPAARKATVAMSVRNAFRPKLKEAFIKTG